MTVIAFFAMNMAVARRRGVVRAGLGLERTLRRLDLQTHAAQQLGQHVVGLELQPIAAHLERHVAIAEVIRGAQQIERVARRGRP